MRRGCNTNCAFADLSRRFAIAAAVLLFTGAPPLLAQDGAARLSVDAAVGGGHGLLGGERVERGLISTDLLVAIRVGGDKRQSYLVGFEAGRDRQMNGNLLCLARADGSCVPQYPGFAALSVVAGHEWRWSRALRVRVIGGPGYYTAYFDHNTTTTGSLGVVGRADLAGRLYQPLSITLAARGAWVPRVRGQSYVPNAVLIGLRVDGRE
jgi:hypothetical protein